MNRPRLTRALTLESAQDVPDGSGGFDRIWMPLGVHWAEVAARGGRQTSGEAGPISVTTWRIVVRGAPMGDPARPEAGQRFREGPRLWRIEAVAERDPEGRYLTCFAEEESAT